MTEYECNGLTGYGMSEYLDQIVDGKPSGRIAQLQPPRRLETTSSGYAPWKPSGATTVKCRQGEAPQ